MVFCRSDAVPKLEGIQTGCKRIIANRRRQMGNYRAVAMDFGANGRDKGALVAYGLGDLNLRSFVHYLGNYCALIHGIEDDTSALKPASNCNQWMLPQVQNAEKILPH